MHNPLAHIETDQIGTNATIMEFAIIRNNVTIGDDVIIHPHVVIEEGISIGSGTEIYPGTYIGKIPKGAGATARNISYDSKVSIGNDCAIGPNAVIFYDVEIGNNTLIGDGASLREQCRIGHHCIIGRYVTLNYNVIVGNNTRIMDLTHITGNCKIGDNVFISVLVATANDNVIINREYDEELVQGPRLDNDVTVGAGAILLPGTHLGEGSFIGSGAVVTKNLPSHVLAMGIPARIIKKI